MRLLFKVVSGKTADGYGLPLGYYRCSCIDNTDYYIESHFLKADEIPNAMQDAKTSAELVAGLLNAFYKGVNVSSLSEKEVQRMGVFVPDEDIPKPNPNQTELIF